MTDPSPERWKQIDDLFDEVLDLEPQKRAAFLDEKCAGDEELRHTVERLLAADAGSSHFLSSSAETLISDAFEEALRNGATESEAPDRDRTGERIGNWRLVRDIGRGGMARVFLAERADGEFQQTVAIKLIRRGLDTDDFVERFRAERRILSSLQHPNIARLIDGGTTERGLPYLALEYVDGRPITEYCEENRCPVEERLRLFADAARVVQHAHANLVVHRDLKPSNILVTADGQVKLLDFGIAKLLDPEADPASGGLTRTGMRPLTPEYASPEQVRGEPITTASDVYQLGVLLYRLLTGERPYEVSGSASALERVITETVPSGPSQAALRIGERAPSFGAATPERLSRRLRGDLDVIVLKALRKEPERRYGSAVEMAEDVRRHLEGRPILARRESRTYRLGKFVRRNAWIAPVTAAAVAIVGLYIGTLIRHGQELEQERNVARDVQQAFVSFFTAPDSAAGMGLGEGRRDLTVRDAILEGADRVREDLADRPAARAELFGAMAAVLIDLDEVGPARGLAEEALAIETELYGETSVEVHETLRLVIPLTTDPDSARELARRRLELSETLYGPGAFAAAESLQLLGGTETRDGNLEEALSLYGRAVDLLRALVDTNAVPARQLAWALGRESEAESALGRTQEALAASREAYEIMLRELGEGHSDTAVHGVKLAGALKDVGAVEEAAQVYRFSLRTMDAELGATHSTTMSSRANYALLLLQMDDYEAAEKVQRELVAAHHERYGEASPTVAGAIQNLALNLKEQGRYSEADSLARIAHAMFLETRGEDYYRTAFPLLTLAEIRLTVGDFPGAEIVARDAARILRATLPDGHYATAIAECRLGRALAAQGHSGEGRRLLEQAAAVLESVDRAGTADYREECLSALAALQAS